MYTKEFTRYSLYSNVSTLLEQFSDTIQTRNNSFLIEIFTESSILIRELEENLTDDKKKTKSDFIKMYNLSIAKIENSDLYEYVQSSFGLRLLEEEYENKSYEYLFSRLLRAIIDYQNKVIKSFIIHINRPSNLPQIFLSYAYIDKGLSFALFLYFLKHGGFLYVNWMWEGANAYSGITKSVLNKELANSNQLLFLRTINSELNVAGYHSIRQWCSWEIGNFYTKCKDEKYFLQMYEINSKKNDMLSTFKVMSNVVGGKIY